MKLIELTINDFDFDSGVDGIALVENPAIDIDFYYFSQMGFETHTYPKYITETAKRALKFFEESGNPKNCLTQVGKVRMNTLAKADPVSLDILKRMKSYGERHKKDWDSSKTFEDGCGYLAMASWGYEPKTYDKVISFLTRKISELEGKEENFDYDLNELPDYIVQRLIDTGEETDLMTNDGWTVKRITKIDEKHKFYNVQSNPNAVSGYDNEFRRIRYAYRGPLSNNSRTFCRRMVGANKLYRYEDVINLQTQLSAEDNDRKIIPRPQGSSIELFSYRGGVNCKHNWYEIEFESDPSLPRQKPIINRDKINQPNKDVIGEKSGQLDNKRVNFSDEYKFSMDEEGRIISPVMVPNMKIPRRAGDGSIYHVYFSEETIRDIQDKYMRNGFNSGQINLEHTPLMLGSDAAYVYSSWIKEGGNDLSTEYGFKDLPKGTWFVGMRILDETVKDAIREGKFKGLSVEGFFNEKIIFGNTFNNEVDNEELMDLIKETLAKLGPRGGLNPSKKAPKSKTKGDGIKGSKKNKKGSASNTKGKIKIPKKVEETLQKKSDEWNEKYSETRKYKSSISQLKVVYQRGVGAFQTSHSPEVNSSEQWALARVNAYLYLLKEGRPQNKKYVGDYDLLPKGHPKSEKKS